QAGKTPADFPQTADDYFHAMDGGMQLSEAAIKGRNTWLIWTGGNEAFWDWLAHNSFGTFDLLKTLSSYPCSDQQRLDLKGLRAAAKAENKVIPDYHYYTRDHRFRYLGLMNESHFKTATKPGSFGLCLDERNASAPTEPFDEKVYGRASGVMGLRIYANPNFDEKARQAWDAGKFYTDPQYYTDRNLIRPYRVGMSCAFCHISHHPTSPPDDPENPKFGNLSGTVGAQYFWFGRIFGPNVTRDNYVWHLLDSQQPGAVDTSFVPTDSILNPRAMNAVFNVVARLQAGDDFHQETSFGGALDLPEVKQKGPTFGVPHILWDGADSVGINAALTRVYINIGEYHQEWIRHIQPIIGLRPQTPIEVRVAQKHSVYWNATQERASALASYLIEAGQPMPLKAAPGGDDYLQGNLSEAVYQDTLKRGKIVFAENCARCHSSKLPQPVVGLGEGADCSGANYLKCWKKFWDWAKTDAFKSAMRKMILADDFLTDNYLSTDARIPVTLLDTEICSSMASNAIKGHVWDNFSSASYKNLPTVGDIELHDPIQDKTFTWSAPGGGRGYQRVPTLVSVWATAPYLHNNEIGIFTNDPSTTGRMKAFDSAIRELLWPGTRRGGGKFVRAVRDEAYGDDIDEVYLKVNIASLPSPFNSLLSQGWFRFLLSLARLGDIFGDAGTIQIGPIPHHMPVALLSNLNVDRTDPRFRIFPLIKLLYKVKSTLKRIEGLPKEEADQAWKELAPDLIERSVCPDFEINRGHTFGSKLPDRDKEVLIEFIKTL
ncbi:MAG: hypothetical protein OEU26_26285, partial [Candidatus Tectomicrobia bacterium]|nr:hypothetical protein [Candidatus Tectomicrobia bacterium]